MQVKQTYTHRVIFFITASSAVPNTASPSPPRFAFMLYHGLFYKALQLRLRRVARGPAADHAVAADEGGELLLRVRVRALGAKRQDHVPTRA